MSAPRPAVVTTALHDAVLLAAQVARAYAWMHDSGYQRETARDKVGSGRTTVVDEDGATMPPCSDPTGEAALAQRRIRDKLAFAARAADRARGQLAGALAALHEIAELVDAGAGHSEDADVRTPRVVSKAELGRARQAQARRIARGEGLAPAVRLKGQAA